MLSVIICSKNESLSESLTTNIAETIGVRFEIVHINNSAGKYSIFEAYNLGISQSRYPFLCLVHDDVYFHTSKWGEKIIKHLSNPETGLVGVAGSQLVTKTPADWSINAPHIHIVQSGKKGSGNEIRLPQNFKGSKKEVILLDGVFLGLRKEITEKIAFDEKLKGFHGYDFDYSLQSVAAGYRNYVIYNVLLEHFSKGRKNKVYYDNLFVIFEKWESIFPISSVKLPSKSHLAEIDAKRFSVLIVRILRRGYSLKSLLEISCKYNANFSGEFSPFRKAVFYIRYFPLWIWYSWRRIYYR